MFQKNSEETKSKKTPKSYESGVLKNILNKGEKINAVLVIMEPAFGN